MVRTQVETSRLNCSQTSLKPDVKPQEFRLSQLCSKLESCVSSFFFKDRSVELCGQRKIPHVYAKYSMLPARTARTHDRHGQGGRFSPLIK